MVTSAIGRQSIEPGTRSFLNAAVEVTLRATGALLQVLATWAVINALTPETAGIYFRGFVIACGLGALLRNKYELYVAHYIIGKHAAVTGLPVGALLKQLGQRVLLRSSLVCAALLVITADLDIYAPRLQPVLETYLPFVVAIPFMSLSMFLGEALRAANRTLLGTVVAAYALNLSILVAAILAPADAPLVLYSWAFFVGSIIAAALAVAVSMQAFPAPAGLKPLTRDVFDAVDERAVIGFAKGLLLWGPLCLLAIWAPAVQMAEYAVAARTAQIVDFFLPALSLAVYRESFRAPWADGRPRQALLANTAAALLASTVLTGALVLAAPATLDLFGTPYASMLTIYALLLLVQWANGVGRPAIRHAALQWNAPRIRRTLGWGAFVAITVCALGVSSYGALAAATGAVLGALIVNAWAIATALKPEEMRLS